MASQSPAALAEILGVPVSSLPSSPAESAPPSGASTPAEAESTPEPSDPDGRNALETISTSTMSVSDYFRQKLREKMLARQAASGSATPLPALAEGSLAAIKEETKVAAGAEWEGTKMNFEETTTVTIQSLGGDEPAVPVEEKKKKRKSKEDDEDKAAKKARKEARRAAKAEAGSSDKEEKRRRKEERRDKKEKKEKKDKKRKRE